jgi:hypothetical protein
VSAADRANRTSSSAAFDESGGAMVFGSGPMTIETVTVLEKLAL